MFHHTSISLPLIYNGISTHQLLPENREHYTSNCADNQANVCHFSSSPIARVSCLPLIVSLVNAISNVWYKWVSWVVVESIKDCTKQKKKKQ